MQKKAARTPEVDDDDCFVIDRDEDIGKAGEGAFEAADLLGGDYLEPYEMDKDLKEVGIQSFHVFFVKNQ